jgi:hypothetical protein
MQVNTNNEEVVMKQTKIVITAVLAGLIGFSLSAYAGPQQNFEKALSYLKKAYSSTSVSVKKDNLKYAKDQIVAAQYSNGGYANAAITLIVQAMSYMNESKYKNANAMIDGAMVKVKHAIQAIKQEAAAKSKKTGK